MARTMHDKASNLYYHPACADEGDDMEEVATEGLVCDECGLPIDEDDEEPTSVEEEEDDK